MSTHRVRRYFVSTFETSFSLSCKNATFRVCVQLGLLFLILGGYAEASVPVQLAGNATSVQFPTTAVGSISASQTVSLQLNTAVTITSITAVKSQGGKLEYQVGQFTGCTGSGSPCTVPITFQPAYAGNRSVSLQVVTSAGTVDFALNGIGTAPQVALTPGTMTTATANGTSGFTLTPKGVAVDSVGNVYIADAANSIIWKLPAGSQTITAVAGNGTSGYSGDGGAATSATLGNPNGVAVDGAGNLYIADTYNQRIREVAAGSGIISTVAGNGTPGYTGDGAAATSATLNQPTGVAVDSAGDLYIADFLNNAIREVAAGTATISTIAGNGTPSYSGDGGQATSATLWGPTGVAVDGNGNLYIVDFGNNRIRQISAQSGVITQTSVITTAAGNGTAGYSGDAGAATNAELANPYSVAVDGAGDLYIADVANNRIREVAAATGIISTVAGNGTATYGGDGGASTSTALWSPYGVALDSVGNLFIADTSNNRVREVEVTVPPILTFPTAGSGSQTIAVSNIGNAALTLPPPTTGTNPSLPAGFALDNATTCTALSPSGTLASGATCTLAVDFTATTGGVFSGALVLTDNALNAVAPSYATQSVALSAGAPQATPTITWAAQCNAARRNGQCSGKLCL
jgi:sugar lactone lactonase YvrE